MNMQSRFTLHGFERLQGRTALEDVDVDGLISEGLAVNVGTEFGTRKVHWLLWSANDGKCFVVVRDEANSEILTVMPVEYHNYWFIKDGYEFLAKALANSRSKPSVEMADLPTLKLHSPDFHLLCKVIFRPVCGESTCIRKVNPPLREISDFKRLWNDPGFIKHFIKSARKFSGQQIVIEQLFVRVYYDAISSFFPKVLIQLPH